MSYRADIDGLRAVAVVAVIFYHAHLGFPGGYVGVDVFFVISGYLLTSIILRRLQDNTFSYLDFWQRRVRRLVPALFVMTLFTAITSYFILLPKDLIDLGGALVAQPLLLANVYFSMVVQQGYFGDPPETRPLLHTWSLGVEEQFYVVFPLLLILLWGRLRSHLGKALLLIASVSFIFGVELTPLNGVSAFFNLPTRAWELLVGALIVFLPCPPPRLREFLSVMGVALIGYAVFFFHQATPFPGTAALVPCIGSALVIWSNSSQQRTRIGRALSNPLMVKVGLASYSLYLWHWPLMAYGDYVGVMATTEAKIGFIIVSFWLGFLSWKWVELPWRDHSRLPSRKSVLVLFLSYALASGSLGIWYRVNNGFQENWSKETLELRPRGNARAYVHEHQPGAASYQWLGKLPDSNRADFILWGDSHAMSMAALFDSLARELDLSGAQLTATAPMAPLGYLAARPFPSTDTQRHRAEWSQEVLDVAAELQVRAVFICGHWKTYQMEPLKSDLSEAIQALREQGVEVYLILDNPVLEVKNLKRTVALVARWPSLARLTSATTVSQEVHQSQNQEFDEFATTLEGCRIIEIAPTILAWESLVSDGLPLYSDNHHLTDHGALQLREIFLPAFRKLRADFNLAPDF